MTDEKKAPASKPKAKEPETVRLVLGSHWHSHYNCITPEGSTLVIDREGVDVAADHADAIIQTAANHGVTIIRSNS